MLDYIWSTKAFPTLLIVLDCAAAGRYVLDSNWRMSLYWFSAAVLTACVTY